MQSPQYELDIENDHTNKKTTEANVGRADCDARARYGGQRSTECGEMQTNRKNAPACGISFCGKVSEEVKRTSIGACIIGRIAGITARGRMAARENIKRDSIPFAIEREKMAPESLPAKWKK